MSAHHRRCRPRRGDRGASAVEFGLLAPVLFILLFGIIDYGIWFADSISARQAVRDVARQGAVENFGSCTSAPAGADLQKLACSVTQSMTEISGTTLVRVSVAGGPTAPTGGPWQAGATLRVCAMTQHDALLPLVPFPGGGINRTRVDMPIETPVTPAPHGPTVEPTPFAGADWASWCN